MGISATTDPVGPLAAPSGVGIELIVEIDISNLPTNPSRVWTQIQAWNGKNRVRSASWTRDGRSVETERTQAGSATIVLDNSDGFLDRNNAFGPFFGSLDNTFWVRISVSLFGEQHIRWTGIKDKVEGSRPASGKDRYVTLTCASAMKVLELFPLSELAYDVETPGDRVTSVLSDVGCIVGTIDAGKPTLTFPAVTFAATDTTSALSHLQNVEQDERGLLFSDASGAMVFQDRYYRSDLRAVGPMATIGETDGDLRYGEADPDDLTENLWNIVAVTPAGGGAIQVALDSLAIDLNFPRRLDQSMLSESTAEALSNAEWYVQRFSGPLPYLSDVELVGARDVSTWPTILDAKNSDLFDWRGGDNDFWVTLERVSETFTPGAPLKVTWSLSPASRDTLWRMGVAGQSEMGVSTRVG